jgi:hypothetical protein
MIKEPVQSAISSTLRGIYGPLLSAGSSPTWTLTPTNAAAKIAAGQMTFSRGTLATQVNADGSLGWAPHNFEINSGTAPWNTHGPTTGTVSKTLGLPDVDGGTGAIRITGTSATIANFRAMYTLGSDGMSWSWGLWGRSSTGTAFGGWTPGVTRNGFTYYTRTGVLQYGGIALTDFALGQGEWFEVCQPQLNRGPLQPYQPSGASAYHGLRVADCSDDTPIGSLGPELVTNGGFDSATGWTLNGAASISGGTLNLNGAVTGGSIIASSNTAPLTVGKTYRVTFRVVSITGLLSAGLGGIAGGVTTSVPGTITDDIVVSTGSAQVDLRGRGGGVTAAVIDNISVREVIALRVNPGIKIEPSATNLCTSSGNVAGAGWGAPVGTVTATPNYALAPDGSNTATRLQFAAANTGNQYCFSATLGAGAHTSSIWLRLTFGTSAQLKLGFFDGTNVLTDTIVVTDKWQRFSVSKTVLAGSGRSIWMYPESAGWATDIVAWGGQLETGSVATSYIPTSGSAATRGADDLYQSIASMAELAGIGGTLVVNGVAVNPNAPYAVQFRDGSSSNVIAPWQNNNAAQIVQGGTGRAAASYSLTAQAARRRQAMAWAATSAALAIDGVARTITQPSVVPTKAELTRLEVTPSFNGTVYGLAYYPIAIDPNRLMLATTPKLDEYLAATWSIRPGSIPAGGTFTRGSQATQVNADGTISLVPANTLRTADYSDNPLVPGIKLEGAATNLVMLSDMTSANWALNAASRGASAPDLMGGSTACPISFNASSVSQVASAITIASSTTYTFSVMAKGGGGEKFRLKLWDGVSDKFSPDFMVTNTWARYTFTVTSAAGVTGVPNMGIVNASDGLARTVQFQFPQAETGTFATSYIPTAGSTATRAADVWSYPTTAVSGWGGQQMSVVAEVFSKAPASGLFTTILEESNGNAADGLSVFATYATFSRSELPSNGAYPNPPAQFTGASGGRQKFAASRSRTTLVHAQAGTVASTAVNTPPASPSKFSIGCDRVGGGQLQGTLYALDFYPQALPANLLKDLTK